MAAVKIPTLPSLAWAIWALILPATMAHHHHVEWKDLMIATNKFPRYFGEVANVTRTGEPKVVALGLPNGTAESMKCPWSADDNDVHCDFDCGDCATVPAELVDGIYFFQRDYLPFLSDLTFIAASEVLQNKRDGTWFRSFFFNQTNLGGKIEIDNTVVQQNMETHEDGGFQEGPGQDRYHIYTGEPDHGNSTASCDEFAARDTAEHTALNQPFWDALYPAKESKLVYTVQDGRLYLTWRLTFNLKDKVGDDFIVWVDARDCRRVVAAAPAEMDTYIKSLEDFDKASDQLFLDHGLSLVHASG